MTHSTAVIVPLSVFRLLGRMVLGNLMVAGGLLLGFGPKIMVWGCIAFAIASAVLIMVCAIRQRPRVVITSEGFAFHTPFGSRSYKWDDLEGRFAVIKIGLSKVVAYHLTAECKARLGKKPTSRFSGYDDVLLGALRLSPEDLADLLNEHRERRRKAEGDGGSAGIISGTNKGP